MNTKKKVFFIFLLVVFVLVLLPFSACVGGDEANTNNLTVPSGLADAYRNAVISPINQASKEITDPDLYQFTQKLVSAYQLDSKDSGAAENITDLVPDIKHITQVAMDMPLQEAGKNITDKDISDFYYSFLSSIGVDK